MIQEWMLHTSFAEGLTHSVLLNPTLSWLQSRRSSEVSKWTTLLIRKYFWSLIHQHMQQLPTYYQHSPKLLILWESISWSNSRKYCFIYYYWAYLQKVCNFWNSYSSTADIKEGKSHMEFFSKPKTGGLACPLPFTQKAEKIHRLAGRLKHNILTACTGMNVNKVVQTHQTENWRSCT